MLEISLATVPCASYVCACVRVRARVCKLEEKDTTVPPPSIIKI